MTVASFIGGQFHCGLSIFNQHNSANQLSVHQAYGITEICMLKLNF